IFTSLGSFTRTSVESGLEVEQLRQMERLAAGAEMADLLAAGEAVGDHQRIGRARAHRRQQHALADHARELEALGAVAERARHPATSGVELLRTQPPDAAEDGHLGPHAGKRLLMAMAVNERTAGERG